ncbi:hypothetical protein Bbelb_072880 [Branchiostoma belcheri]|nr:hypothetical protein Bbelb_072880 [Branchiostoma belcheri]
MRPVFPIETAGCWTRHAPCSMTEKRDPVFVGVRAGARSVGVFRPCFLLGSPPSWLEEITGSIVTTSTTTDERVNARGHGSQNAGSRLLPRDLRRRRTERPAYSGSIPTGFRVRYVSQGTAARTTSTSQHSKERQAWQLRGTKWGRFVFLIGPAQRLTVRLTSPGAEGPEGRGEVCSQPVRYTWGAGTGMYRLERMPRPGDLAKCAFTCLHGGICVRPNRCSCQGGYRGVACHISPRGGNTGTSSPDAGQRPTHTAGTATGQTPGQAAPVPPRRRGDGFDAQAYTSTGSQQQLYSVGRPGQTVAIASTGGQITHLQERHGRQRITLTPGQSVSFVGGDAVGSGKSLPLRPGQRVTIVGLSNGQGQDEQRRGGVRVAQIVGTGGAQQRVALPDGRTVSLAGFRVSSGGGVSLPMAAQVSACLSTLTPRLASIPRVPTKPPINKRLGEDRTLNSLQKLAIVRRRRQQKIGDGIIGRAISLNQIRSWRPVKLQRADMITSECLQTAVQNGYFELRRKLGQRCSSSPIAPLLFTIDPDSISNMDHMALLLEGVLVFRLKNREVDPVLPNRRKQSTDPSAGTGSLSGGVTVVGRQNVLGLCYADIRGGQCVEPLGGNARVTQAECCKTFGKGWGDSCFMCPHMLDIDECKAFPWLCENGRCTNNPGSFHCKCRAGYMMDATGTRCIGLHAVDSTLSGGLAKPGLFANLVVLSIGGNQDHIQRRCADAVTVTCPRTEASVG